MKGPHTKRFLQKKGTTEKIKTESKDDPEYVQTAQAVGAEVAEAVSAEVAGADGKTKKEQEVSGYLTLTLCVALFVNL